MTELRAVLIATCIVAMVVLCMVHHADHAGAPIALAYGWGVDGVADMARHVHADGWNLDSDQAEQDTGYLHMFSSVRTVKSSRAGFTFSQVFARDRDKERLCARKSP